MRVILVFGLFLLWSVGTLAALPIGSVVIYSDGGVEKLLAKEGDRLRWEDDRKRQFVRSTNPVIPLLERRDFLSGRGYVQRVAGGDPAAIRNLPQGSRVGFSLVRVKHDGSSTRRNWECIYLGDKKESVLGQQRRLERYRCERYRIHRKFNNRAFRERRDISYSPELGFVVDLRRETRTKQTHTKLAAILSPEAATYQRIRQAVKKVRGVRGDS